jgi:FtsP/CotA-like multicopper oxidase with cupredoxin domain
MIDGMPQPFDVLTPEDALHARVGETRIWEITNMTGGMHNFHPHGFFFQPLEIEYVDQDHPERNRVVDAWPVLENKDTMRIPARRGGP